jgi:hypothetical protein
MVVASSTSPCCMYTLPRFPVAAQMMLSFGIFLPISRAIRCCTAASSSHPPAPCPPAPQTHVGGPYTHTHGGHMYIYTCVCVFVCFCVCVFVCVCVCIYLPLHGKTGTRTQVQCALVPRPLLPLQTLLSARPGEQPRKHRLPHRSPSNSTNNVPSYATHQLTEETCYETPKTPPPPPRSRYLPPPPPPGRSGE